jgi:hypothetical protein
VYIKPRGKARRSKISAPGIAGKKNRILLYTHAINLLGTGAIYEYESQYRHDRDRHHRAVLWFAGMFQHVYGLDVCVRNFQKIKYPKTCQNHGKITAFWDDYFSGIALIGVIPGSDIDVGGSSDPAAAIGFGIAMLCGGIIAIVIPIVVGFVTLRQKHIDNLTPEVMDFDPLPPAS